MSELPPRTVTVTGTATVAVRPDRATLNLGVQAFGATAAEAMAAAAQRAAALVGALRSTGATDEDLRTTGLNLWFDQHEQRFVAGNQLMAGVPVDAVGDHIDAAAGAAGDQFTLNGVSFSISDTGPHVANLRADALADARRKAGELAEAENATVGEAFTIVEGAASRPVPVAKARGAMLAMDMPVEAGADAISLSVTVTYALR
jgi:uncharacterized protein YggE